MTTDGEPTREAVRRTLALRAGADASVVCAALLVTWKQIALRLTPIIGAQGVEVLFARAMHLTIPRFPWLASAGTPEGNPVASFQARLEAQDPSIAEAAGCEVLVTFTELLETLIGRSLSAHLLAPVWGSPTATSKEEQSA